MYFVDWWCVQIKDQCLQTLDWRHIAEDSQKLSRLGNKDYFDSF